MVRQWWLYALNVTDRTNIVCFFITIAVAEICIAIAKKVKLPVWKFQVAFIKFMELFSVCLLIVRLTCEQ